MLPVKEACTCAWRPCTGRADHRVKVPSEAEGRYYTLVVFALRFIVAGIEWQPAAVTMISGGAYEDQILRDQGLHPGSGC